MNRLVIAGFTAIAFLLGEVSVLRAEADYSESSASTESSGSGGKLSKKRPSGKSKRRARAEVRGDEEDSGSRKVWTENSTARIKTIYDEQGNVVYQKAWDKKTGKEVPVGESGEEPGSEVARDLRLGDASEARPYGRLRREEDGDYGERRSNPRPQYKNHNLHHYGPDPTRHPYEFSLGFTFWSQYLSGWIQGTGGKGTLDKDWRSTFQAEFHNSRVGYSYLNLTHSSAVTGGFTFNGITFASGGIYSEDITIFDGFFRWPLYHSQDSWMDWLLGAKVLLADAKVAAGSITSGSVKTTVPLPELGLIARHNLLDNIHLRGFAKLAYGALSGKSAGVIDAELEAVYTFPGDHEYAFLNQFSLGLKYTNITFEANKDGTNAAKGSLDHIGPYVKYSCHF